MRKAFWKIMQHLFRPARFMRDDIRNILVIRMNRTGDMICTIPLLKTLRREFPGACLTVLAEDTNANAIENAPYIDKVIVYKKNRGIFKNKHIKLRAMLKDAKFDLAIGVKGGFSSNLAIATFMSRARYRVGYVSDNYHPLNLLYNLPVQEVNKTGHQIEQCLNLLSSLGIRPDSFLKDISVKIPEKSRAAVQDFLHQSNVNRGIGKIIVLSISNSGPETTWPVENFIQLLKELKEYRIKVIITAVPADSDKAVRIAEASPDALYYKTPHIMDLAAIVEIADLFVCHDSGAMHIGAAAGGRILVLIGRGIAPEVWGPYGEGHKCLKKTHIKDITIPEVSNEIVTMLNIRSRENHQAH
ncbi:MAG: glycosyltransferase family 9 protein [Nitrospirae bacterium]|nr:glycosyltransferase family 9 protein [Nitrospirota bacterium]MCL5237424.1 glycosyltransferase family 9 protein [Nitrospirota bacterium]